MALLAEHLLKPLPADKQIETGPFLEAVSHLPPFFDCLGSPVFTPIKADISGNITMKKLRQASKWQSWDSDPGLPGSISEAFIPGTSEPISTCPPEQNFRYLVSEPVKSKPCMTPTQPSSGPCRTSWRWRKKCMEQSGPK
uniref:Glycolipid transfer protein n=1 Tax=Piliocolobus tephrosceles TaxID=591936 RepID=A0A8C9HNM5_9PRIM